MNFSNTAAKYQDRLKWDSRFVVKDRQEVIDYLKRQNIEPFKHVIDFQVKYSGIELTLPGKPGTTFYAHLFSQNDIKSDAEIDHVKINGRSYFFCGDHETAQFWFVLSETGEICTYNNQDESINPLFSSFQKFIETYAQQHRQRQNKLYEHPPYYKLKNSTALQELVSTSPEYTPANDQYNQWYTANDIVIYQGTWFQAPTAFIHMYGKREADCEKFVQSLKAKGIIE
ncbi:MAG: hypothetical protein J7623_08610 [Chitinophaga sp.]|uniref:hypothetical protein n=1 Tax=Chitinophaga sp. TaxID=1869181 RepID=UPI001B294BA1|nr:hypothetical protein [Chitinophaga sp.]MBO9728684.1 hypothetical protein [Chitinophaga sp.]